MSKKRDYYEVLGINKNASEQEIKTAYRSLAKKYHPDKLKDGTSDQKMQELNEAYEILSNPEKRSVYDQYGHDAANGKAGAGGFGQGFEGFGGFGGFEDIFENIFGGFGGSRRSNPNRAMRGDDIRIVKKISFMQSINGDTLKETMSKYETCLHCGGTGAESKADIKRCDTCNGSGHVTKRVRSIFGMTQQNVVCETCSGTGQQVTKKCSVCRGTKHVKNSKNVNIPIEPGIKDGTMLRLSGYGEPGINGGPAGDLFIQISIAEHKFFKRNGNDLYLDFPVSFIDIALENVVEVPTPYGNVKISMKKSYESGQIIRVPKKGINTKHGAGDLKLVLQITYPDISKSDNKEMLKVFQNIKDSSNQKFTKSVEQTLR